VEVAVGVTVKVAVAVRVAVAVAVGVGVAAAGIELPDSAERISNPLATNRIRSGENPCGMIYRVSSLARRAFW